MPLPKTDHPVVPDSMFPSVSRLEPALAVGVGAGGVGVVVDPEP
ncbi:MAG: hypothetical protein ABSB75_07365 [Candidatus Limnocylindrales bacterium]